MESMISQSSIENMCSKKYYTKTSIDRSIVGNTVKCNVCSVAPCAQPCHHNRSFLQNHFKLGIASEYHVAQ